MRCRNAGFGEICLELIRRFGLSGLDCFSSSINLLALIPVFGMIFAVLKKWDSNLGSGQVELEFDAICEYKLYTFAIARQGPPHSFPMIKSKCEVVCHFTRGVSILRSWQEVGDKGFDLSDVMILMWKKMEKGAVTEGTRCCQVTMLASWSKDFKISGRGWDVTVRDDAGSWGKKCLFFVFFRCWCVKLAKYHRDIGSMM